MDIKLNQLGKGAGGSEGSGGGWTPEKVIEIINGIKELAAQAQAMKGGSYQYGGNGEPPPSQVANQGGALTIPQVKGTIAQILDNLIAQGHGDDTLLKVLEATPATIKQIRSLLK